MKKIMIVLLCIKLNFCYSQKEIYKEKQWDLLLVDNTDRFSLLENKYNKLAIEDTNHLVFFQKWRGYGGGNLNKEYVFKKDKDTMIINCKCGQEGNLYLKNFKFQKGKFELSIEYKRKYNKKSKKYEIQTNYFFGKQLKVSENIQNILFKNSYICWESKGEFKDTYFKNLKFDTIDLKDSINVKLKKIE